MAFYYIRIILDMYIYGRQLPKYSQNTVKQESEHRHTPVINWGRLKAELMVWYMDLSMKWVFITIYFMQLKISKQT